MPNTYLFTVDNIGQGESIVVQTYCKIIRLRQNDQSVATFQPFVVRLPGPASPGARREGGDMFELANPGGSFYPGQILGYVELINAAAVQFVQEEF